MKIVFDDCESQFTTESPIAPRIGEKVFLGNDQPENIYGKDVATVIDVFYHFNNDFSLEEVHIIIEKK